MNTIFSFVIEVVLTLTISLALVRYLRPFLKRILVDLCGTEDRAQFWTAFSNILLIGMPLILSLIYRPQSANVQDLFFDVLGRLGGNIGGLLLALVGIGFIVAFFALVAPKPSKVESK
jgi:hypothetical protein